jgi:hypothetical protein
MEVNNFSFSSLNIDEQIALLENEYQSFMEVSILSSFDTIMNYSVDSKTNEKSIKLGELVIQKMNPYSFDKLSTQLFNGMKSMKWQVKQYSLLMLSKFANIHPLVTSQNLPEIITNLIIITSDPKKEIKNQTIDTFYNVCNTIENVDIKHLIPIVISAYINPSQETQKALDALVSTPFVNDIDIPTLGFLVPLLTKSMRERKMVFQRRAAVVIETLTKLLKNPVYAKIFYPILEPVLTKGYEEIAEIEIRNVCLNSRNVLTNVYNLGVNKSLDNYNIDTCKKTFFSFIDREHYLINHSIDLIWNLVKNEIKTPEIWENCMEPYLKYVITDEENRKTIINKITKVIKT